MRTRLAVCGAVVLALCCAARGGAYWLEGPRWPSGSSIVMHLQLGSSGGVLRDGSASWDAAAEDALAIWNPYLSGVSFRVVRGTESVAFGNGVNNVFWDTDVYGDSFGDAIAITTYRSVNGVMRETDVVFDQSRNWNSYRGDLTGTSRGGTLLDLHRVALHEFGHVLGLDHPDEHGQSVAAVMNSRTSNIDSLQADDIAGVRAIYSASVPSPVPAPAPANHPPTVTASCNPCTVRAGQTATLTAAATDPDGDSVSYQWTASQGTFSNAAAATTLWTAPGQSGNVTATVTVRDGRGGSATASVGLQVVPGDRLPSGGRLLSGQSITSTSGRYRLVYQTDGNLVLYDDVARIAAWSSNTVNTTAGQAVMQADGNFVIYDGQGRAQWTTNTVNNPNAYLMVQNDGNLVVYRSTSEPIWDRFSAEAESAGR